MKLFEKENELQDYTSMTSMRNRIIKAIVNSLFMVSILSMFTVLVGSTLDGIIISHFLKAKAFGAFGLASPLYNLLELIASVVATGCAVICGNKIGGGDAKGANQTFASSFTLSLITGTLFMLFLFFFPQSASILCSKDNAEMFYPLLFSYVRGMAPGIPAMMLSAVLMPVVQLDGDKKKVILSANVLCITNLLGDLFVVTMTDWGMMGVGITTSLSYYCSLLILLLHFRKKEINFRPYLTLKGLNESLPCGIPPLFNRSATMLRNYFFNILALTAGGAFGVVAWTTVNNCTVFLSGLPKAFGQASMVGSGVFYGEKDKDSLKRFISLITAYAMILTIILIAVLFLFTPALISVYMPKSSPAYADAVSGLRWYGISLIPYTLNMILLNYFQSAKKKILTNVISFMDGFGSLYLFALFLMKVVGFRGLCMSFFFGKTSVFLILIIGIAIHQKSFKLTLENIMMLPKDFDVPEEDRYTATIEDKEEGINLSEEVTEFCRNRGIDHHRGMLVGLALEEWSDIIIDQGFNDGKKHTIDIKVFIKDNQIMIRFRDDCNHFDANQRLAFMHPDHEAQNVNINLLNKICTHTDYYGALNVNYMVTRL